MTFPAPEASCLQLGELKRKEESAPSEGGKMSATNAPWKGRFQASESILMAITEAEARRELRTRCSAHGRPVFEIAGVLDSGLARNAGLFVVECSAAETGGRLGLIERFRQWNPQAPVIAIAVDSSEALAVAAFRLGVRDYFRWPGHAHELDACLDRCLHRPNADASTSAKIVGQSPQIREVLGSLQRAAATESNVLVDGETGTGKEAVAESLHYLSARGHKPLVSVNCAAIPETLLESELFGHERGAFTGATASQPGKLQQADGGTIFFDEIGDMDLRGQAKLLRALETREVLPLGGRLPVRIDTRIVAASNQDLEGLMRRGLFRADLLFRLNVVRIHLPPLRERLSDVPALLMHFARQFNERWGTRIEAFDEECCAALCQHDWPGNIRELRNAVEVIYVNSEGGIVRKRDLPPALRSLSTEGSDTGEKRQLLDTLFAMNWNVSKVAQKMQWSRMTVYRKLARYQIARNTVTPGA
jgi:DNA-binding NtrC family response regulator